jgi:hypothetical protein
MGWAAWKDTAQGSDTTGDAHCIHACLKKLCYSYAL